MLLRVLVVLPALGSVPWVVLLALLEPLAPLVLVPVPSVVVPVAPLFIDEPLVVPLFIDEPLVPLPSFMSIELHAAILNATRLPSNKV